MTTLAPIEKVLRAWRRSSLASSSGVLPAMLTVASLTLLVKVVSAAKEIQVARSLGVGDSLDAFYIAFLIPGIIVNIVGTSLNTALIPTYIRIREQEGPGRAYRLYSSMLVCSLLLLFFIAGLLALTFPAMISLIGGSFGPAKVDCTRSLFFLLLPVIALVGISTTWGAVLNASNRFGLVAVTPIITPLTVLAALLMFGHAYGVYALAGATLAGAAIEAGVLGCQLIRLKMPLGLRWHGYSPELKQVIVQYLPVAAGALIFSGTSFADQTLAARLSSGAVSRLAYGNKIVGLVISVGATAVGASVLPHFSRLVALGEWERLRAVLRAATVAVLVVTVPTACILGLKSAFIVRTLFERGAFTAADTGVVSHVQACYSLGIPVYILGAMYLRLISAMSMNKRILVVAGINVVLNFALDLAFMRVLGAAGIALSTSLVSFFSCIVLYCILRKPLQRPTSAAVKTYNPTVVTDGSREVSRV
ncbi:MAG TPA: lipid II flippase MurJ [Capsulimonadaceae bacterium]|nr:lipid II flippase MurJ [Capsulimonadaceae bacterium]